MVRGLGASWLAVALVACSTTATITRANGYSLEGTIRGGSADSIVVDPKVGERKVIPRSDVEDIDHPGNVHALLGGLTLVYGAVLIASPAGGCFGGNHDASECAASTIPVAAGVSILAWGLATWIGSKNAASDVSLKLPPREKPGPRLWQPPPEGVLPPPPSALPSLAPSGSAPPAPIPSGAPPAPAAPVPSSSAPVPSTEPPVW